MEIIQSTPKTQSASSKYAYEDFIVFVERAEEGGIEQKFQFIDGEIIPTHSATPLSHWFIDYVLSKDFGTQPITLQFDMATINHGKIISNLHILLGMVSEQKNINIYAQGTFVHVEITGSSFLPDLFFTDINTQKHKGKMSILNPLSIFEVLSKSTKSVDKNEKLEQYKEIDSLVEYVIIDQYKPQVTVHTRIGENRWEQEFFNSLSHSIFLESIKHTVPLVAIYKGVSFEE